MLMWAWFNESERFLVLVFSKGFWIKEKDLKFFSRIMQNKNAPREGELQSEIF